MDERRSRSSLETASVRKLPAQKVKKKNDEGNVRHKRTPANSKIVSSAGDLERRSWVRSASYSGMCVSRWKRPEGKGMLRTRLCLGYGPNTITVLIRSLRDQ